MQTIAIHAVTLGIAIATLFLIACSGGDNQTLALPGGVVTEAEYRSSLRAQFLGLQGTSLCMSLRGLSGSETFEALADVRAGNIVATIPDVELSQLSEAELRERIATLETAESQVQAIVTVAASDDGDRAGQIIQEECRRILNE